MAFVRCRLRRQEDGSLTTRCTRIALDTLVAVLAAILGQATIGAPGPGPVIVGVVVLLLTGIAVIGPIGLVALATTQLGLNERLCAASILAWAGFAASLPVLPLIVTSKYFDSVYPGYGFWLASHLSLAISFHMMRRASPGEDSMPRPETE
jgi:hypothetical protein